jgi:gamma-glutamyltranspeptidase/glutathione hydrolase
MWFCLTLLKPHLAGVAGDASILLYLAEEEKVIAVNGQGPAPLAASINWFEKHGYSMIPEDGFLPAVVPGAFDAWLLALETYGLLSVPQILEPAIRIASEGFPAYPVFVDSLASLYQRYVEEWPSTAQIYLPNRRVPKIGQRLTNPDWAQTFRELAKVAKREGQSSREAGIEAARDYFYRGPIAKTIVHYQQSVKCRDVYGQEHHGLLTMEDFERYHACFDTPVSTNYRGIDVFKCGPWSQGPVLLQQLNLLEGFDLTALGHNSVEYIHTLIECAKLAFADREHYYADPDFVDVPLDRLLSKWYADRRRQLIDPDEASLLFRPGGVAPKQLEERTRESVFEGDTVHIEAGDEAGNMISATPSGGWIRSSPIIPNLGFCLGTRGQLFHLDTYHVEKLEPGKKPSTTLSPSLALREGAPYLTFGTPGADCQDQWPLQFFLNYVHFDMNVQAALDAPTVHSNHFPGSFWPHAVKPGEVAIEPRIPQDVIQGLRKKGHKIVVSEPWSHGRCLAICYNAENDIFLGGASPRTGDAYVIGW